jgi:predicted nucleotidyltransferase
MIEGYYAESSDGLLFAVKGLIHPPFAVVAYLRYIPDPDGDRKKGSVFYRRLYDFEEQEELLRNRYPAYFFFDPVFGEQLQGVPHERIARVYDPCLKLADLRSRQGLDELEEKAVEFADLLVGRAKVPEKSIGVSGSVLVGLHTPHSDVDIAVYGSEHCRAVHSILRGLPNEPVGEVRRLGEEETRQLYASRSQDTPADFEDFVRLEGRKVIQGKFRGCEYFIRFVKAPAEVEENYGERRYNPLGQVEIEAIVVDASEAIFTPCTYKLGDVQYVGAQSAEAQRVLPLCEEIVSFRGRFCEQALEGERVIAKGKLERVVTREGKTYHRLLLGRRGDFMTLKVN